MDRDYMNLLQVERIEHEKLAVRATADLTAIPRGSSDSYVKAEAVILGFLRGIGHFNVVGAFLALQDGFKERPYLKPKPTVAPDTVPDTYTSVVVEELERKILAAKERMDKTTAKREATYEKWRSLCRQRDESNNPRAKTWEKRIGDAAVKDTKAIEEDGLAAIEYYRLIDQRNALLPEKYRR